MNLLLEDGDEINIEAYNMETDMTEFIGTAYNNDGEIGFKPAPVGEKVKEED